MPDTLDTPQFVAPRTRGRHIDAPPLPPMSHDWSQDTIPTPPRAALRAIVRAVTAPGAAWITVSAYHTRDDAHIPFGRMQRERKGWEKRGVVARFVTDDHDPDKLLVQIRRIVVPPVPAPDPVTAYREADGDGLDALAAQDECVREGGR